ncbi:hypothetical protein HGRIS_007158 [Hohenbuehelia grisea]|uniref:CCR4-NOT transcription complex subunit 11 n=1 Tax=Hohenbuehelia grisea TaxID=104357 RepID=A0ABR3JBB3_9AGAR
MATHSATTRPRNTFLSQNSDFVLNVAIAQRPGAGIAKNLNWKTSGLLNRKEPLSATFSTMHAPPDPVQASVSHLLARAMSLPCSTAAQAFLQLIQPTERFRVALDALLPLLEVRAGNATDGTSAITGGNQLDTATTRPELPQRILVSYILYSLYTPHPIAINPFKSALLGVFFREREVAMTSNAANEQLVWVLWKILKGDGNDISPYTPITLARSPLPPKLRASNLVLSEGEAQCDTQDAESNQTNGHAKGQHTVDSARSQSEDPSGQRASTPSAAEHEQNERIGRAMSLILAAKERVLTLTEQRFLLPLIPALVSGTSSANGNSTAVMPKLGSMITSLDLAPLAIHNPTLAHPLIAALLVAPPSSVVKYSPELDNTGGASTANTDLPASVSDLTASTSVASFTTARTDMTPSTSDAAMDEQGSLEEAILNPTRFLDVLTMLPPTLPAFDLVGRLLRDPTVIPVPGGVDHRQAESSGVNGLANGTAANDSSGNGSDAGEGPKTTVSDLVRSEYLGPFVHGCIEYLNHAEQEEREGRANEDRWGVGVRNLCRFYQSLIKLQIVDPSSDADSAEMAHFSLQNARFEEAIALYRVFANANANLQGALPGAA